MGRLRWLWPLALAAALALGPRGLHALRPQRSLAIVVLDKTVPFPTYVEHRSLFWLLDHLKIVRPGGGRYDPSRDYLGAFPGPRPGDRPSRTVDLTEEAARAADLLYLADTYGVYEDDLESGPAMRAALERSPKVYGGLSLAEAEAAVRAVARGTTLVAEFNTLGSPTAPPARTALETALGVHWTRWMGRYFSRLEDRDEVPEWLRRDWEREWSARWEFTGPGYVLLRDDTHCEVLLPGRHVEEVGLTIERERPVDRLLAEAGDGTSYPYWFDLVEARPGTEVLASFSWHLTDAGRGRLERRGLPARFPAVTRKRSPSGGAAYYFAGDFADNPLERPPVPLAGYLRARRALERIKIAPSEGAFYWRFYAPMMTRLLDELASRGGRSERPGAGRRGGIAARPGRSERACSLAGRTDRAASG